jgi:glucose/arabinose dehydrogenase
VVERAGRIIVIRDGHRLRRPFLDMRGSVQTGGESGMLSMAFAPDYALSRRFYVYYVDKAGFIRVDEFERARGSADRALPGSRRLLIRQAHRRFNHKGGQLQFGPDGMLYMGFGDGGGMGDPDRNAQNLGRLLGKLLRIDPRPAGGYGIPPGNPFAQRAGARREVYAYGLRNPYRFSFDRLSGDLTIGDVGQERVEEIDFVRNRRGRGHAPRGGYNFGWSVFEGRHRFRAGSVPGHVPPVIERTHRQGSCSIIGGYVIRDRSLGRPLYGRYVYGDLCDSRLRVAALRPGRARGDRLLGVRVSNLVSFGEDARGRVYAVSLDGPVYRLAPRR